ncbi:MAG TPA: PQQ-binding-like beta-propeller repeat protein [Gemmataceae bacterium]|nr:PQQ-binding-like beta-propeller repeat protein [Gemmataceae bacterium]
MQRILLALVAACTFSAIAAADNWPAWRGPTGQGQSSEKSLPIKWSAKDNVRWKVALPDTGSSTPVIWGDRIFVTQASDKTWPPKAAGGLAVAKKRSLFCFDRADGKVVWQKDVIYPELEATHPTNPYCSASPVTDGERIVVSFGSAGMYCYDFKGSELWKRDLGKLEHIWGNASSPILYKDLAILWAGPGDRQFLIAVNKKTGEKVWHHDEPGGADGLKKGSAWIGSWSTPVIANVDGKDQLILSVPKKLKGFDPATGKELWSCDGLGNLAYTSPLVANGIAVAMSGYHGPALAVKLGGTGDITKDRLWHHTKGIPQRIGSGVIVGEHLYMLSENGTPQCFEIKTGHEVWKAERAPEGAWGSMVHADGKLYIAGRNGTTMIFAASPKYELLATNKLGEHTDSSIAISNGELFIRTYKNLWCIGK